jgi:hypothetical protein
MQSDRVLTSPVSYTGNLGNQVTQLRVDPVWYVYSFLFNNQISLKDRNKWLLLFLQHHIVENNICLLKDLMSELTPIRDMHISFVKAILMMTEHVEEVQEERDRISDIYNQRKG